MVLGGPASLFLLVQGEGGFPLPVHPLNTFLRIRASNVAQSRETFTRPVNLVGTFDGVEGPLPVGASVILSLAATGAGTRKLWMRGCPSDFYFRDPITGRDSPSAQLKTLLADFFKQLKICLYGIRKLQPVSTNPTSPYYRNPIKTVDGSLLNGTSVVTLAAPPLWAQGQRVVIGATSKKDTPSLNGHFSVIAVAGNTFTIPYQTPQGES